MPHSTPRLTLIAAAVASLLSVPAIAQEQIDLDPNFTPPAEYREQYGDFRSVLKFDDDTVVGTAEDWQRRRKEIRTYWHNVLGPWPKLVEEPRIKFQKQEYAENFTRHTVEVEISSDRFVGPWFLLVPDGKGPFPAVVVPWYNAEDSAGLNDKQRDRVDFGYQLAKRGYVTLCIGEIGPVRAPTVEKGGTQPLSFLAYAAANCCNALAAQPNVDPKRIGIVGHSFGGKWSMFASCLHDRFACAVWVDPGIVWNESDANANYWEKWYLGYDMNESTENQRKPGIPSSDNPRTGAYKKLVEERRDLHELHALMSPRPFLVSGGAQDRPVHWTALNHTIRLNKLLGHSNRVAMTMRDGHSPTRESNAQVYAFFDRFLKAKENK